MSLNIEVHCIEVWPRPFERHRKRSAFKATYTATLDLLEAELSKIGAKNVVLQMALTPSDIRLDGKPRADAWPSHPGVILSFQAKHGATQMPCDRYDDWRDNVRAIAMCLKALRDVDRHGVTTKGEQYAGWTRIGAPGQTGFGSPEAAKGFLKRVLDDPDWEKLPRDMVRRTAERKSHPDTGGSDSEFKKTREALEMLGY